MKKLVYILVSLYLLTWFLPFINLVDNIHVMLIPKNGWQILLLYWPYYLPLIIVLASALCFIHKPKAWDFILPFLMAVFIFTAGLPFLGVLTNSFTLLKLMLNIGFYANAVLGIALGIVLNIQHYRSNKTS